MKTHVLPKTNPSVSEAQYKLYSKGSQTLPNLNQIPNLKLTPWQEVKVLK